jgi:hypothetical protein
MHKSAKHIMSTQMFLSCNWRGHHKCTSCISKWGESKLLQVQAEEHPSPFLQVSLEQANPCPSSRSHTLSSVESLISIHPLFHFPLILSLLTFEFSRCSLSLLHNVCVCARCWERGTKRRSVFLEQWRSWFSSSYVYA